MNRHAVLCILFLCTGCASHVDRLHLIRTDYYAGNLTAANQRASEWLAEPDEDADVLRLDQAVIELTSGRPAEAEQKLRLVRNHFDHFQQADIREVAASMLTDDTARAYAGDDHEKVLVLCMLAISNLMSGGDDAQAYALQIGAKQQELIREHGGLEEHPELSDVQVALGPYLQAAIAEERRLNFDNVIRARTQVVSFQPEFRDATTDLERAKFDAPMQPGNGAVYVIALVGRGPIKEETAEIPTQAALLIADRILSHTGKYELPPTIAPVRVPKIVTPLNRITHLEVAADGDVSGETATLVDVSALARAHHEAEYPRIVGRAIARRVIKKASVVAAKDALSGGRGPSPVVDIGLTILGVAWEARETADTRCWGLLPDSIQVLRLELPAGETHLTLRPSSHGGAFGVPTSTSVQIHEGRNTYLLASFPNDRLVGQVVTSAR